MASSTSRVPLNYKNIDNNMDKYSKDGGISTPIYQNHEKHRNYGTCAPFTEATDVTTSDIQEDASKESKPYIQRVQRILDIQNLRNLLKT